MSRNKFTKVFFIFFLALLVHSTKAHAATLSVSPASQSTSVGKTIVVKVLVNSAGQSINAVSGGITFSNNVLTLTSISKGQSIVSLWAQAPSYSNTAGTASFQGVVLNGFNGTGTILTLIFKAKAEGVATISLAPNSSSVLLNDGQGTNVLTGTSGDTITIGKTEATTPPAPTPIAQPSATQQPVLKLPVVNQYQSPLLAGNFIVVRGTADPNSTFTVTLSNTTTAIQSTVSSDSNGAFTYVSDNKVKSGTYTVIFTLADGSHTQPVTIVVKNPLSFVLLSWLMTLISFKINLFWTVLFIILSVYLWHRNRVLRRHLQDAIEKVHSLEQK